MARVAARSSRRRGGRRRALTLGAPPILGKNPVSPSSCRLGIREKAKEFAGRFRPGVSFRSILSFPVNSGNEVIGVADVDATRTNLLSPDLEYMIRRTVLEHLAKAHGKERPGGLHGKGCPPELGSLSGDDADVADMLDALLPRRASVRRAAAARWNEDSGAGKGSLSARFAEPRMGGRALCRGPLPEAVPSSSSARTARSS